jgi:DNA-binding NtrC family response regulator
LTKQELEDLRALKHEVKQLQHELQNMPIVMDSVNGSMEEFPYTQHSIKIFGIDQGAARKLRKKLERKLEELQDAISDMEDWLDTIPDSEMRTILRLTYRNGLTREKVAEELGRSEKTIKRKIKTFFQNVL